MTHIWLVDRVGSSLENVVVEDTEDTGTSVDVHVGVKDVVSFRSVLPSINVAPHLLLYANRYSTCLF